MNESRSIFCTALVTLTLATMGAASLARAATPIVAATSGEWIKVGKASNGTADFYLGTSFSSTKGKYPAISEKGTPDETIEGEFLVGQVKYVYPKPLANGDVTLDEDVVTSLLNCERRFTGTWKRVAKLKGKIVSSEVTPASKLLMVEIHEPNTGSQLCELHKQLASKAKGPSTSK